MAARDPPGVTSKAGEPVAIGPGEEEELEASSKGMRKGEGGEAETAPRRGERGVEPEELLPPCNGGENAEA